MVLNTIILKLAARCNLDCTYCYWFRDKTVFDSPALLTDAAEAALLEKTARHVNTHSLRTFNIVFHGGEPLLVGKQRFSRLCAEIRSIEASSSCKFSLGITTNGVLIDDDWVSLFREFDVLATLSIDGPEATHDKYRIDHAGKGSFAKAVHGLRALQQAGLEPSILAVCNLNSDPLATVAFFVDELKLHRFDILVPDATHEDKPPSIAPYYMKLFDVWYGSREPNRIRVRFIENIAKGVLGIRSNLESIGYGPVSTAVVLTDGALEPLDVLRITKSGSTKTGMNIASHELQDLTLDPAWREAYEASVSLHSQCNACEYRLACGGGYLPHRWSNPRRFDNPSVYCEDLKTLFSHAAQRIRSDVYLETSSVNKAINDANRTGA